MKDVLKKSNAKFKILHIAPARVDELSKEKDVIFPFLTRSPDREDKLTWVGKLATDKYCFISLKKSAMFNSIDEAKKAKSICAAKAGVTEKMLVDKGFTNVDAASDTTGCARKLMAGKVDALISSEMTGKYLAEQLGGKAEDIHCGADLGQREYWIAASKNIPSDQLDKLKASFSELEKAGKVEEHVKAFMK